MPNRDGLTADESDRAWAMLCERVARDLIDTRARVAELERALVDAHAEIERLTIKGRVLARE